MIDAGRPLNWIPIRKPIDALPVKSYQFGSAAVEVRRIPIPWRWRRILFVRNESPGTESEPALNPFLPDRCRIRGRFVRHDSSLYNDPSLSGFKCVLSRLQSLGLAYPSVRVVRS